MPIGAATPRDKFDQVIAFLRRTMRYWWLVVIISMLGGTLSVAFALYRKPRYVSEAKVFYNERIQSSILQGRDGGQATKNLGTQYSEMLMARTNMTRIIEDNDLFPETRAKQGIDAAIEEFQKAAQFRVRGIGMFHLSFQSPEPENAQAVTDMMVDILISEDRRLRRESASATMSFLLEEKAKVRKELDKRQRELAAFLAENPEFALESGPGAGTTPGASIRAQAQNRTATPDLLDPRLLALERQRRRIQARLDTPDAQPPPRSAADIAAERAAESAQRELQQARNELDDKMARFTAAHPDVIRAKSRLAEAEREYARAKAQVPPPAPQPTRVNRAGLQEKLLELELEIAQVKATAPLDAAEGKGKKDDGKGKDEAEGDEEKDDSWVVSLETTFQSLNQGVAEQRNRLERLDASLSNAEITASQQMAEQGAVLTIIDPPNLPTLPQGKGRLILVVAGTAVFVILGAMLALALALVDDRIYKADDLTGLAIAPMVVVVPKHRKPGLLKRLLRRG